MTTNKGSASQPFFSCVYSVLLSHFQNIFAFPAVNYLRFALFVFFALHFVFSDQKQKDSAAVRFTS